MLDETEFVINLLRYFLALASDIYKGSNSTWETIPEFHISHSLPALGHLRLGTRITWNKSCAFYQTSQLPRRAAQRAESTQENIYPEEFSFTL